VSSLALTGLVFGVRHALEPDHLTVIATILTETRSLRRMARVGAAWGLGHGLALLAVTFVLGAVRAQMPVWLADAFELAVAAMLLILGVRAVRRACIGIAGAGQCHPAGSDHVHLGRWAFTTRPLVMGLVHGLAGSGLITAMVAARFDSVARRVAFTALFGIGATVGMVLVSGALGCPLAQMGSASRPARIIGACGGLLSTALGVAWGGPLVCKLLR
jgi:hypothetical protein